MIIAQTALIVGGSTILGGILGLLFKTINKKAINAFLVLSYGIMLTVAVTGLVLPSIDEGTTVSLVQAVVGVLAGAVVINCCERLSPLFGKIFKINMTNSQVRKSVLLVLAIIVHNLPEGMATGMGFLKSNELGLFIMIGIAVQNVPEGMIVFLSLLTAQKSMKKAALITVVTAVVETFGVLLGFYLIEIFSPLLNFLLAFSGGAMLFAVGAEILSLENKCSTFTTYLLILGFLFMLVIDCLI